MQTLNTEADFQLAFARYRALSSKSLDMLSTIGSLMYLVMLKHRLPSYLNVCILLCAIHCLWPFLLPKYSTELYRRHRDKLMVAHFILHHGIVPNLLSGHINSGHNVQINSDEIHWFIIGHYILGSSLIWHVVNPLVYKINYKYFLAFQPLVILLSAPSEVNSCVASTTAENTAIAAKVFGTLSEVVDMLHALFLPLPLDSHHRHYTTLVDDTTTTTTATTTTTTTINNNNNNGIMFSHFSPEYAYHHCIKVQSYLLVLCAYCLPAYIIWRLETHARQRFILMLEADGGGKEYSVEPRLMEKLIKSTAELEYPWSSHNVREGHIGWMGGAFLCSCTCWGVLDFILER